MSRILKTSGFLGLTIQMLWGMYNVYLLSNQMIEAWMIGAHAHFGVLGILAIVLGFAVDHFDVVGTRRQVVTYFFIIGQWLLPATILVAFATGMLQLEMLNYLWGIMLAIAMGTMALEASGS